MHKVHSPSTMAALVYKAKEDGIADVWIRANETTVPATDESPQSYEADEVFFQVHAGVVPETEIAADLISGSRRWRDRKMASQQTILALRISGRQS